MRIAIITPIGPGHENLAKDLYASAAKAEMPDDFDIDMLAFDDTDGEAGRSTARNVASQSAYEQGFDWLFYVDADDLIDPRAFRILDNAVRVNPELDAIWGEIWAERAYVNSKTGTIQSTRPRRFTGCVAPIDDFGHICAQPTPHGVFSVGHFVRAELWYRVGGWIQGWDVGEDHEFNWACAAHARAFAKLNRRLVHIRTYQPSAGGPRGYGPQAGESASWPLTPAVATRYDDAWQEGQRRAASVLQFWRERGPVPFTDEEQELRRKGELYPCPST